MMDLAKVQAIQKWKARTLAIDQVEILRWTCEVLLKIYQRLLFYYFPLTNFLKKHDIGVGF